MSRTIDSDNGYYLYNGHGDVVVIIDDLNEVLNTYIYDVFGNIVNESEILDNPYKYAGYYYDTETDNYYLLSRYYNPIIARFISEDTYRGELNDPLSLNRYVYVNNNPMIYIDPNGYFFEEIWEGTKYVGTRIVGAVHGAGELAFDAVVGIGTVAWNTGEFIGSSIGVAGNYYVHQLGLTSEDTYNYFNDEYMKTFTKTGQTLVSLPGNIVNGVIDNFKTTFNVDNFVNYLTTDNYNEIKDYSKSVVQTGLTIYGGYKLGKAVYNKITIPSSFGTMNKTDAARYNQYWDNVKNGLTSEQRYNMKLYEDINGSANYKINITKDHSINKYGEPRTITRKIDNNGMLQDRIYDLNGKAYKDIDFMHSEKTGSHFFPHEHIWEWINDILKRK